MKELVVGVLALALAAFVATAGIGYLAPDAAWRIDAASAASTGFRTYGGALTAYRVSHRGLPAAPYWKEELAPFLPTGTPRAPAGYEWSYGRDASGPWICISSVAGEGRESALRKAAAGFPNGAVIVGASCAGVDHGGDTVAATYRPIRS